MAMCYHDFLEKTLCIIMIVYEFNQLQRINLNDDVPQIINMSQLEFQRFAIFYYA